MSSCAWYWSPCLLSLLIGVNVSGCVYRPPPDKNGNLPDWAVRNFIKLVQAEDYQAARRLWYGESRRVWPVPADEPNGEVDDQRIEFEDFCAEFKRIDLKSATISKPRRGKSGFSMVHVDWHEDGVEKHIVFGLKIIDGEWRMERGYYW